MIRSPSPDDSSAPAPAPLAVSRTFDEDDRVQNQLLRTLMRWRHIAADEVINNHLVKPASVIDWTTSAVAAAR